MGKTTFKHGFRNVIRNMLALYALYVVSKFAVDLVQKKNAFSTS